MADNAKKYLDQSGVEFLWGKVREKVQTEQTRAEGKEQELNNKLTTLEGTVGTHTTNINTLIGQVDALEKGTYDDSELRGRIETVEADYLKAADKTELQNNINTVDGKVTTLIGEDANKSVRTIANEELAKQLIAENASDALDTLAEIAAWIQAHPEDASAMNEAIVALQNKVDTGEKTVSVYVADAIAALSIGDYAKASELTALATRVTTAEGEIDDLQAEDIALGGRVTTLENAGHQTLEQVNSAIDTKITALNLAATYEAKGAATTAETNANSYTDTAFGNITALSTAEIDLAIKNAEAKV